MTFRRSAALAAAALTFAGCSGTGYVLPTTTGSHTSGPTTTGNSSTTGGSTSGSGTTTSGTTTSSSTSAGTTTSGTTTTTGTTGTPPANVCAPNASGSLPLGGTCDANGTPGTCVGDGFYCLIDGDAGLCPSASYVSGYPFATILDGGAADGGLSEVVDLDAGQPVFSGVCAPTPGAIALGDSCNSSGPNDPFGGCVAGAVCLGTCQATCDVRDPLSCGGIDSGKACRSIQSVGFGAPDGATLYPLGVCTGCLDANPTYACAVASECCQSGTPLVCFGARTSPLLDGGFAYGTCALCTACENDPVACPCVVNADCCNSGDACIGGTCTPCVQSGASGSAGFCASSSECCSPGAGGVACVGNSCQACLTPGNACQIDDDCCSGLCDELALICR